MDNPNRVSIRKWISQASLPPCVLNISSFHISLWPQCTMMNKLEKWEFLGGRMRLGRCCKEWCAMYSTYEYT